MNNLVIYFIICMVVVQLKIQVVNIFWVDVIGFFMVVEEYVFFIYQVIDIVVCKNSGGDVIVVKFEVVCELGFFVFMFKWFGFFLVDKLFWKMDECECYIVFYVVILG